MASVTYYRAKGSKGKWHLPFGFNRIMRFALTGCGIVLEDDRRRTETTTTPDPKRICRRCERGDNHLKG
jgi:hypothetical protein